MVITAALDSPDRFWMRRALQLALCGAQEGEVPVGALLLDSRGELLAEGWNRPIVSHDPTAHAEVQVLRRAAERVGNYRLPATTLYVTLEPCPMCAGALVQTRVERVVFAASDPKGGAAGSCFNLLQSAALNHQCAVVGGVMAAEAAELLRGFFRIRRQVQQCKREASGHHCDSTAVAFVTPT